jgi:riboflavin biosynthesis pyrimidine reductase
VALPALLQRLAEMGVRRLMVEGGALTITSFLSQQLVNLIIITIAPVFVGGLNAIDREFSSQSTSHPSFPRLDDLHSALLGTDLIVWGKPARI